MSEKLFGDDDEDEEEDVIDVESEVVSEDRTDEGVSKSNDDLPTASNSVDAISPVENLDDVVETYEAFEEIKERLLTTDDLTKISGGVHVNKSGWRKIATAFNLSVGREEVMEREKDGVLHVEVVAQARAPNGSVARATGVCSSNESNFMEAGKPDDGSPEDHEDYLKIEGKWRRLKDTREVNMHNLIATAETRAKNRAISDLVGGGEVSSEELGEMKKQDMGV